MVQRAWSNINGLFRQLDFLTFVRSVDGSKFCKKPDEAAVITNQFTPLYWIMQGFLSKAYF